MERDPRGWNVTPAPDGRGKPEPPKEQRRRPQMRPPSVGWRWIAIIVIALALNYVVASTFGPNERPQVTVPYSPYFLGQVTTANVREISSQGETIEGHFRKEVAYKKPKTDRFKTQVPTFADTDQPSAELQTNDVPINAEPIDEGRGFLYTLLVGFGPTLLIVGLFILLARRATGGAGGGGPLGAFGRSRAKRVEATHQHVTFDDVAGIEEAKAELAEVVDFLRNSQKYTR